MPTYLGAVRERCLPIQKTTVASTSSSIALRRILVRKDQITEAVKSKQLPSSRFVELFSLLFTSSHHATHTHITTVHRSANFDTASASFTQQHSSFCIVPIICFFFFLAFNLLSITRNLDTPSVTMLTPAALSVLAPFFVGLSQAAVVDIIPPDNVSANVTLLKRDLLPYLSSTGIQVATANPCYDRDCFRKFYDEKKECHPYDNECYKDCSDWDDYKHRCTPSVENEDPYNPYESYDKCYDKCYYEREGCYKYRKCRKYKGGYDDDKDYGDHYHGHYEHDKECYKKTRDEPEPPKYRDRFCKPECKPEYKDCHQCKKHREEPDKYECDPRKDKHEYCLPYYDDHHDHHHHDYHPFKPKSYITAHFYNDHGKDYVEKVWPDGDEHWFNEGEDHWKRHFDVNFIKYYSEKEDGAVRCLPTKSYFPWTPLKIEKFVKLPDEYGLKVHGLYLEKSQPVEVIRCDLP
ncbi:hypothetical protein diail_2975 [Diaporthe ilicicola]|nr:hypothetical protein diail_2975 [Diaporthe ilicicola]